MSFKNGCLVVSVCTYLMASTSAHSDQKDISWYINASSACSGPTSLISALYAPGWMSAPVTIAASTVTGAHAQASVKLVQELASSGGSRYTDRLSINSSRAETLRNVLANVADSINIPFSYSTFLSLLPRAVLNGGAAMVTGSAFSWLIDQQNVYSQKITTVSHVVADGGQLNQAVTVSTRENIETYITLSIIYDVKIGNEDRSYILLACSYPLEILVSTFRTDFGINDKVVRKRPDRTWEVFDVTSNKIDKQLIYLGQDHNFYYFKNSNDSDQYRYRLSFTGGPYQFIRPDESIGTFYETIIAE